MKSHRILITLFLIVSLALGPAEAGILSWLWQKFWSLFPSNKQANVSGVNYNFNTNVNGKNGEAGASYMGTSSGVSFGSNPNFFGGNYRFDQNGNRYAQGDVAGGFNFGSKLSFGSSQNDANSQKTASFNFNWNGPGYKLTRRQNVNGQQCTEETSLVWLGGNVEKTFKSKCKNTGNFNDGLMHQALLLIGNPAEEFCLFSSKENEYYYKENRKWKKANIVGDKLEETVMKNSEIAEVAKRISKWREVFTAFQNDMRKIGEEQKVEGNKHKQEVAKIVNSIHASVNKYNNNLQEIDNLVAEENLRKMQDNNKFTQMSTQQGWTVAVQNYQSEMQQRAAQARQAIQARRTAENDRFQRERQELQQKLNQLNYKNQQENAKFQNRYNQRTALLNEEYVKWIRNGY